jgi:GT2 family glycosyltransferase
MIPHVLIIILCHNGIELTLACLESLHRLEYRRADMLIVDNASSDATPAIVRSRFPDTQVIETGTNLGFAAGNNVGLRYALAQGYDYALLLNNDTEIMPNTIQSLIMAAESDPQIGVAGPMIYYYDQPDRIWSAGGAIDWQHGVSRMLRNNEVDPNQGDAFTDVDFVSGCALLCKRSVLERVGLLDERFFMYYEETEWCVRAKRAGYRIVHVPQASILHKIPLDARADRPYVAYYMTRNRLLFLRATGANLSAWVHAALRQDLRTCVSLSVRPKWRARRAHRDAMISAWGDFLRGKFGRWTLS